MYNCPFCGRPSGPNDKKCGQCGADLAQYANLYYTPDYLYNEALKLSQKEEINGAIELLLTAHMLRPNDVEILELLASLYLQKNEFAGAMEKCLAVLELAPDNDFATKTVKEIEALVDAEENNNIDPDLKAMMKEFLQLKKELAAIRVQLVRMDTNPLPGEVEKLHTELNSIRRDLKEAVTRPTAPARLEPEKPAMEKTLKRMNIALIASLAVVLLSFGLFYYRELNTLTVKTSQWGRMTESSLTQLANLFDNQMGKVQQKQTTILENHKKLAQGIANLNHNYQQLVAQIQDASNETVRKQLEEIRNKLSVLEEQVKNIPGNAKK